MSVFIVEDHDVMRTLLREMIRRTPDLDVIGEASNGEEALEYLASVEAALILIDVSLSAMSGIDLARAIRERWPERACLMMSGHREQTYVDDALAAGAMGYVLKDDYRELPEALRQLRSGERYLSASLRDDTR